MKLFVQLYQIVDKNRNLIDIRHAQKNVYSDHNPSGKWGVFGVYLILNVRNSFQDKGRGFKVSENAKKVSKSHSEAEKNGYLEGLLNKVGNQIHLQVMVPFYMCEWHPLFPVGHGLPTKAHPVMPFSSCHCSILNTIFLLCGGIPRTSRFYK